MPNFKLSKIPKKMAYKVYKTVTKIESNRKIRKSGQNLTKIILFLKHPDILCLHENLHFLCPDIPSLIGIPPGNI